MEAAFHNENPEICRILISAGAGINQSNYRDGMTPLLSAASGNTNPEVLKVLLENGADPYAKDMSGKTAYAYILANPKLRDSDVAKTLSQVQ
jgi:ankyrin repeat protein